MAMSSPGHKLPPSRWQRDPGGNKHMVGSICCAQTKNRHTVLRASVIDATNGGHVRQQTAGKMQLLGKSCWEIRKRDYPQHPEHWQKMEKGEVGKNKGLGTYCALKFFHRRVDSNRDSRTTVCPVAFGQLPYSSESDCLSLDFLRRRR